MREEKSKFEMDRCLKQLEHMRYELAASRQREAEVRHHSFSVLLAFDLI